MARHRLRITFDDDTDNLTITHQCDIDLAGHTIRWSDVVQLDDSFDFIEALKALVNANREEVEKNTSASAIQHISAMTGRVVRGQRRVQTGGDIGPSGGTE